MNRMRMLILAATALSLSVGVTFVVYRMLQRRLGTPAGESVRVVVAAKRLPLGVRITSGDVRTLPWPQAMTPEGSFNDPAAVIGRGVVVALAPHEPILESKVAPREAGAGLTPAIPEGMRAVAVKVNDVIGVAGFVLPGTRVDVILTGSPDEKRETQVSRVILENVQVLAAGQNIEQNVEGKPQNVQVVTLLVTPEESQKLALAAVDGRIQLALRNPLDTERMSPQATARSVLYRTHAPEPAARPVARPPRPAAPPAVPVPVQAAAPPPVVNAAPAVSQVELIQGRDRATLEFTVVRP